MAFNHSFTRVLVALALFYSVFAANTTIPFADFVNKPGNANNLTVAINVPKGTSNDDLFVHFSAPTFYQWAGFGFGKHMSGSLLFIMYTASNGKNITLSPRVADRGTGQPTFTQSVKVEQLAGSGVNDTLGRYILNFRCTGCRKWLSSQINLNDDGQDLIWALGPKQADLQKDMMKTDSVQQTLLKHTDYQPENKIFLSRAVGDPGVPVLATSNTTLTTSATEDAEAHEFPILVHALLLLGVFVFIFPGGYLLLRVFNKVWLHAGVQTLGVVTVLAGIAAGIVYNVQTKRSISYHQVLGILTSILVLAAFTLGLISHAYFKKHQTSSPLMLVHRITGPSAIGFGWATCVSGFVFAGVPRRILPFAVVLIAVVIFVGSITFLLKKRAVRKAALKTPAAQNFNAGYFAQQQQQQQQQPQPVYGNGAAAAYFAADGHADAVPMQTFAANPYHQQPAAGYAFGQKHPGVSVQSVGYH